VPRSLGKSGNSLASTCIPIANIRPGAADAASAVAVAAAVAAAAAAGDYPIGCDGPISQDNGTAILACYLGTMLPGTQASITLKFTPVATANYTPILGQLMFPAELESMENDIVASNNSATTWLAVVSEQAMLRS
jgi:hypothetical protein